MFNFQNYSCVWRCAARDKWTFDLGFEMLRDERFSFGTSHLLSSTAFVSCPRKKSNGFNVDYFILPNIWFITLVQFKNLKILDILRSTKPENLLQNYMLDVYNQNLYDRFKIRIQWYTRVIYSWSIIDFFQYLRRNYIINIQKYIVFVY